jgi:hypothetical protein
MRLCTMLAACAGLALLAPACASHARQETGQAAYYPWSGYWWPHRSGGLIDPLSKYDDVYQTQAAAWERDHHVPPGDDIPPWFGHCHAWSASGVIEREPRVPVR